MGRFHLSQSFARKSASSAFFLWQQNTGGEFDEDEEKDDGDGGRCREPAGCHPAAAAAVLRRDAAAARGGGVAEPPAVGDEVRVGGDPGQCRRLCRLHRRLRGRLPRHRHRLREGMYIHPFHSPLSIMRTVATALASRLHH